MSSSLIDTTNIPVVTNIQHGPHTELDHHIINADINSMGLNIQSLD